MAYIYMDESGDLGFDHTKKQSNYFIVTFLFSPDPKKLEKIVKKVIHTLAKTSIKVSGGVLHCTKEKNSTRKKILSYIADSKDISIMTIYIEKSAVYTNFNTQTEKHIFYNYVVNILLDRILTKGLIPNNKKITFIASRRETNKILNANFISYLENETVKHPFLLEFCIKTPAQEKGLQVVDFVSRAIYQKYEKGEKEFYSIIENRIIEEKSIFS